MYTDDTYATKPESRSHIRIHFMNHDYIGSFWQCQMSQKHENQQRYQLADLRCLTLVTLLTRCFLMLNHLTDFMQVCMFANTCNNSYFPRKTNQTAWCHPDKPRAIIQDSRRSRSTIVSNETVKIYHGERHEVSWGFTKRGF